MRSELARGGAASRRLRLRARAFLAALDCPDRELSILLVGDSAMRALNRAWRGVDRPTDVLSFPAAAGPGAPVLGDVVVSLDTARRQARRAGRSLPEELDRYLAHGILHLLGHDHGRPAQARAMAALEDSLLAGSGMVAEARAGSKRPPRPPSPRRGRRPPVSRPSRSAPRSRTTPESQP